MWLLYSDKAALLLCSKAHMQSHNQLWHKAHIHHVFTETVSMCPQVKLNQHTHIWSLYCRQRASRGTGQCKMEMLPISLSKCNRQTVCISIMTLALHTYGAQAFHQHVQRVAMPCELSGGYVCPLALAHPDMKRVRPRVRQVGNLITYSWHLSVQSY